MLDTADDSFLSALAATLVPSFGASVSAITVSTTSTVLLGFTATRRSFFIENTTNTPVYIRLGVTSSPMIFSHVLVKAGSLFAMDGYSGPVSAITAGDSTIVMVTEAL